MKTTRESSVKKLKLKFNIYYIWIFWNTFIHAIDPFSTDMAGTSIMLLRGTGCCLKSPSLVPLLRFCTHNPLLSAGHLLCANQAPNTVQPGNQVSLSWPMRSCREEHICWTTIHQNREHNAGIFITFDSVSSKRAKCSQPVGLTGPHPKQCL